MTALEQRYRTALRWYPRVWRTKNEEAVLGTLLDKAEEENRTAPVLAELANLAIHGIVNRLRLLPSEIPAAVRDRTSTAALAIGTAIALAAIMQLEGRPDRYMEFFGREYTTFGPFASPVVIVYVTWIAAFFTSIAGHSTAARWITGATIPLIIGARIFADANDMFLRPTWTFLGLLILLSLLVIAGSPTPSRRSVGWLAAWFLPALIIFTLPQTLFTRNGAVFQSPLWLERPDLLSLSPIIAVMIAAAAQLVGKSAWSAAVLLIGVPFTAAAMFAPAASTESTSAVLLIAVSALAAVLLLRFFGFSIRIQRTPRQTPDRGAAVPAGRP